MQHSNLLHDVEPALSLPMHAVEQGAAAHPSAAASAPMQLPAPPAKYAAQHAAGSAPPALGQKQQALTNWVVPSQTAVAGSTKASAAGGARAGATVRRSGSSAASGRKCRACLGNLLVQATRQEHAIANREGTAAKAIGRAHAECRTRVKCRSSCETSMRLRNACEMQK